MNLQYTTMSADLFAKLDHIAARSPVSRHFTTAAYVVICGLMWVTVWRFYAEQRHVNNHYLIAGGCALLFTGLLPWLYGQYQKAFFDSVLNAKTIQGLAGDTQIILSEIGVMERRGYVTITAPWTDIEALITARSHYFLVVAPLVVIAVPFRLFADKAEHQVFEALVNDRLSGVGNSS